MHTHIACAPIANTPSYPHSLELGLGWAELKWLTTLHYTMIYYPTVLYLCTILSFSGRRPWSDVYLLTHFVLLSVVAIFSALLSADAVQGLVGAVHTHIHRDAQS